MPQRRRDSMLAGDHLELEWTSGEVPLGFRRFLSMDTVYKGGSVSPVIIYNMEKVLEVSSPFDRFPLSGQFHGVRNLKRRQELLATRT